MLNIKQVSNHGEFEGYKGMWNGLLEKSNIDNVFMTYEWVDTYIRHFCVSQRLLILNIFEGDRLIGIAPLMIRKYKYLGLPVRAVSFIGAGASDRMDFILTGDKEKAIYLVLDHLMGISSEWDLIDLEEITEKSATVEIIEKWLQERNILNFSGPQKRSFLIQFDGNRKSLVEKFSGKLKKRLTKLDNKNIQVNLDFKRYRVRASEVEAIFSDICDIEDRSWQGKKQKGIFTKNPSRDFHKEIFDRFSRNGQLDISVLMLEKKPIAYIYNYLYGGRSYNYNVAFDNAHKNLSAGTMLMFWMLKDSAVGDISEFDFMRGEEPWKKRLTSSFKLHNRVRIFKGSFYSRSLYVLQSKIMPYFRKKNALRKIWITIKEKLGWY
ncbi:MAG: GNAT family N-acetyltransferase [Candidatus Gorgyraea atricola]|nr:GNAT family N-acetyltransferase [Candidatus Gorgyraea atricola]